MNKRGKASPPSFNIPPVQRIFQPLLSEISSKISMEFVMIVRFFLSFNCFATNNAVELAWAQSEVSENGMFLECSVIPSPDKRLWDSIL